MSYTIKRIQPRHYLIIQYAFNGLTNIAIGEKTGMSPVSIGCILRSPAAQAELSRLASLAVEKSVDIPARIALHNELVGAAITGLKVNKALLQDPFVKPETRSRIGQHFMDRVIFDKRDDGDREHESYRDILRKLDKLQATVQVNGRSGEIIDGEIVEEKHQVDNLKQVQDTSLRVHKPDLPDALFEHFITGNGHSENGKHVIDLGEVDD